MCFKPTLSRCSTNTCIGGCTLRYGFLLCPVNSPPPGPVDSPPPGRVDSPPPGPGDSPPPGPVDTPPPGPVEAPPPGPVESPPHRRVDNPPPVPVDRSRGQPLAFMPAMLGDSTGRRGRPLETGPARLRATSMQLPAAAAGAD